MMAAKAESLVNLSFKRESERREADLQRDLVVEAARPCPSTPPWFTSGRHGTSRARSSKRSVAREPAVCGAPGAMHPSQIGRVARPRMSAIT